MSNKVFIATSLDGYIADKEGGLDWLHETPNPENIDCGFKEFMKRMDAVVMGRNTFETVMGFDSEWPYEKPVFVLSHSLKAIPSKFSTHAKLMKGSPIEVVDELNTMGYQKLYIDGGVTIQNFLRENLIDEIIISTLPILLGGGASLFGELSAAIKLDHLETKVYLNAVVQSQYKVRRIELK